MRRDAVLAAAMLALGLCLALPFARSGPHWYTDSLYYEAQKLEVRGVPQPVALRRVFTGELARPLRGRLPRSARRRAEYARFYARRWTVPALAAALTPIAGTAALRDASLLGWAILAPLLFLLLRRRFSRSVSVAATAVSMVLPPLLTWAPAPLVDSWGLSMLVAGLLLADLTREDLRWLPAWIAVVLVGSFTRDIGLILIPATAWLALRTRSRGMGLTTAAGALASLPALLVSSVPLRENLAYIVNGFSIPDHPASWSWIAARYPGAVLSTVGSDLAYPFHVGVPQEVLALALAIPVLAGLWLLARAAPSPFMVLMRGAALAATIPILLSPNYTGLRIELVFVPAIAVGLALVGERIAGLRHRAPGAPRPDGALPRGERPYPATWPA